ELAARQRLGQPWQGPQRARHADALASRASIEAHTPREPRGAGAEAGVPAAAGVELSDEIQQVRGSRVEVRGQFGDLITEPIQMGGDASGGFNDGRDADTGRGVHRRLSSVLLRRSTPRFSSVRGASRTSDRGADALLEKSVPIDDLRGWRVS